MVRVWLQHRRAPRRMIRLTDPEEFRLDRYSGNCDARKMCRARIASTEVRTAPHTHPISCPHALGRTHLELQTNTFLAAWGPALPVEALFLPLRRRGSRLLVVAVVCVPHGVLGDGGFQLSVSVLVARSMEDVTNEQTPHEVQPDITRDQFEPNRRLAAAAAQDVSLCGS